MQNKSSHASRLLLLLAVAILGVSAGCWQPAAPKPIASKRTPAKPIDAHHEAGSSESSAQEAGPSDRSREVGESAPSAPQGASSDGGSDGGQIEPAEEASSRPRSSGEGAPVTPRKNADVPVERILVFSPAGPLVIDVKTSVAGAPPQNALEELVDQVMRAADANKDGEPTWEEVVHGPRFVHGQLGNMPISTATERHQVIKVYDVNHNRRVDRFEVLPFLTNNQGGARAFTLGAPVPYRGDNLAGSAIRHWLDADEDGLISTDEITQAPLRLRMRDADDDAILYPRDFLPPDQLASMPARSTQSWQRETALRVGPGAEWERIAFALEEYSSSASGYTDVPFAVSPRVLEQIDANRNGRMERAELTELSGIPPHVVLEAHFEQQVASASADSMLRVTVAPQWSSSAASIAHYARRTLIRLPALNLTFFLADTAALDDYKTRAHQLLLALDRDKNGYLENEEAPDGIMGLAGTLQTIDTDGDGKVYRAEIESFFTEQQAAARTQIRLRVSDHEDALLTALDIDGDNRLSAREISGSAPTLRSLDRDGDGALAVEEIPASMLVGLVRGIFPMGQEPSIRTPPTLPLPADVPQWFMAMDENGDGEISRREFPGRLEAFQQMDADGNDFIDLKEALGTNRLSNLEAAAD